MKIAKYLAKRISSRLRQSSLPGIPKRSKGFFKGSHYSEQKFLALLQRTRLFDPEHYLAINTDVALAGVDPQLHYIRYGMAEGRAPSAFFDPDFYLAQFPQDQKPAHPLFHYLECPWDRAPNPSPYFDQKWYLKRNDIAPESVLTPADHYLSQPRPFNSDPSPLFSNSQFLSNDINTHTSDLSALTLKFLSANMARQNLISAPRSRIASAAPLTHGCDALVFVATCPSGALGELQRRVISTYKELGFFVVTCINVGNFNSYYSEGYEVGSDIVIIRENIGSQIESWADAVRTIGGLAGSCRTVSFTNDRMIPLRDTPNDVMAMVRRHSTGIVFASQTDMIEGLKQPDFFTINRDSLEIGALRVVDRYSKFHVTRKIFDPYECSLFQAFQEEEFESLCLFDTPSSAGSTKQRWREPIENGYPFFNLDLITEGVDEVETPEIEGILGPAYTAHFESHLQSRNLVAQPRSAAAAALPIRAIPGSGPLGPIGEIQAYNYPPGHNPAIQVPLDGDQSAANELSEVGSVLTVVHCFYVDVAERILSQLDSLALAGMVLCTTDTEQKKRDLETFLAGTSLPFKVVVVPNRGRDVAPFLIEGARYVDEHDFVLHLHTKKSLHSDAYADWGAYLFRTLMGSKSIALSVLKLLDSGKVGLLYAKHFREVDGLRNWGFDFEKARGILTRLDVDISVDQILEFPTSTMFWARSAAIRPLFDLNLTYEDFDPEEGQIDGTLAHAIERCLLYVCEKSGYQHYMVTTKQDHDSDQVLLLSKPEDLERMEIPKPLLLESFGRMPSMFAGSHETYPVQVRRGRVDRQRFNILIPTVEPEQIYGGISSALKIAKRIYEKMDPDTDVRIIVTSDRITQPGVDEAAKRIESTIFKVEPQADMTRPTITSLIVDRGAPISLRQKDVFFATAWWTADLAYRLQDSQQRVFGAAAKIVYLIQDYEPGFYPWSFQSVMAKNTYETGDRTLAVINSEELANFMTKRYRFPDCWHIPYEINEAIACARRAVPKDNLILVYGRPKVSRNLFGVIVEGLRLWQADNPMARAKTRIVFAGEEFDDVLLNDLMNATAAGKLSLDVYADTLSRAAVGISLMESPHPSYPPFEMASSGCVTITNGYQDKDMTLRSDNILSLTDLSPQGLRRALDTAFSRVVLGEVREFSDIRPIGTAVPLMSYGTVAEALRVTHRFSKR